MILEVVRLNTATNKQNTFSIIDSCGISYNHFKLMYEDKNLKSIERVLVEKNVICNTMVIDINEFIKSCMPMEAVEDIIEIWNKYSVNKEHLKVVSDGTKTSSMA